ncbi:MAG TPA: MerR family transcriptional regulator [Abditibacteriaceae bacterium]
MAGWTAREIARYIGVPPNTVTSWIQSGLVTPDVLRRGRAGHEIGVSALLELLAVVELKGAGLSVQAIRRAVENLRQLTGHKRPLVHLTLVVQGEDIVWRHSEEVEVAQISALHHPGQRLMIFPIGEQHQSLLAVLPNTQTTKKHSKQSITV